MKTSQLDSTRAEADNTLGKMLCLMWMRVLIKISDFEVSYVLRSH